MKRNKISFLAYFFSLALFLSSCGKSYLESCKSTIHITLSSVTGPDTAWTTSINSFQVYFDTYNGCGQFSHFEETSIGNTKTIKVFAKYESCVCTQIVKSIREDYNYTVTQTGTYIFNFVQPNNTYITHTVTVYR